MRSSTLISIGVALTVAIAAVVLSASYLRGEREAAIRSAQEVEEQKPQLMIVVAAKNIEFGEKLTLSKLRQVPWYSDETPDGIFTNMEQLVANSKDPESTLHAMTPFQAGEPIHQSRVTKEGEVAKLSATIKPGFKAVSIRVNDVLGVAGFVLPGDHVDVLLTRNEKGRAFVDVLLQSVKVLAIDQLTDNRTDQPSVVRTVTFEVDTRAAQKLTLGATVGVMSLALRNIESTGAERNNRISMNLLGSPHTTASTSKTATTAVPKQASIARAQPKAKASTQPAPKQATSVVQSLGTVATNTEAKFNVIGVTRGRGERKEYLVASAEQISN